MLSTFDSVDSASVFSSSLLSHVEETLLHKSFVIRVCLCMSRYLVSIGNSSLSLLLLERANIHDNSKLVGPELSLLSSLSSDRSAFTNPSVSLSACESRIIESHWSTNRHHPEYFSNVLDMSELDIIEMVCDWYARSLQYNTDFFHFINSRQESRFHFPSSLFKRIYSYCEIIDLWYC